MINILLLNWNSFDDIEKCINQIFKSEFTRYRVILIDNNSDEIDKNKIVELFNKLKIKFEDKIYLVKNSENFGYAGGNNAGYDYLKENNLAGDILILNPDVLISENTLGQLNIVLNSDVGIGAVMCRTVNSYSKIMYDYISMDGLNQKWLTSNNDTIATSYVAGSCMLLKREVIDKIGLFNSDFFMYWEEVDLSFRIKKCGYKLLSTTTTEIVRKDNDKSRSYNMNFYMTRNIFLMKKLHSNISTYSLFIELLKMFKASLGESYKFNDLKYITIFFKGVIDGFKTSIKI